MEEARWGLLKLAGYPYPTPPLSFAQGYEGCSKSFPVVSQAALLTPFSRSKNKLISRLVSTWDPVAGTLLAPSNNGLPAPGFETNAPAQ